MCVRVVVVVAVVAVVVCVCVGGGLCVCACARAHMRECLCTCAHGSALWPPPQMLPAASGVCCRHRARVWLGASVAPPSVRAVCVAARIARHV